MLREINQIENYQMKANFLRENGWTDLWHVDNWVRKVWFDSPTINVDKAGLSIGSAYVIAKKEYDEIHQTKLF
jgi:hypothetical protein